MADAVSKKPNPTCPIKQIHEYPVLGGILLYYLLQYSEALSVSGRKSTMKPLSQVTDVEAVFLRSVCSTLWFGFLLTTGCQKSSWLGSEVSCLQILSSHSSLHISKPSFGFMLGPWFSSLRFLVRYGFCLMEWALTQISYWLVVPACLCHHYPSLPCK